MEWIFYLKQNINNPSHMVLRKHMFYFNLKCANMFTLSKCKHSLTIIYLMGEFFLNVRPPPLKCRRLLAHVRQLASQVHERIILLDL